jgi:hypothetical protein
MAAPPAATRAPEPAPATPAALVGRRVARSLGGVPYEGVVASERATASFGHLWRVVYDDGDTEDMSWPELREALLPPEAARGAPGRGACGGRRR